MPAGKYSFVIEAGATFNLDFTMYTGGSKWNLTGYSARMDIRVDNDWLIVISYVVPLAVQDTVPASSTTVVGALVPLA